MKLLQTKSSQIYVKLTLIDYMCRFAQFKKHEKHPRRSVTFSIVAGAQMVLNRGKRLFVLTRIR